MNPTHPTAPPLILIVDDAADLLEAWKLLLEHAGLRVLTADRALEGLEIARRCRPSLIVTDLMIPGMDGMMFCRALRADARLSVTPIIMWSAAIAPEKPVFFDRFLSKPVFLNGLLREINALLPHATERSS